MTSPMPGRGAWLPDPINATRLRYWDGEQWSDHVLAADGFDPGAGRAPASPLVCADPEQRRASNREELLSGAANGLRAESRVTVVEAIEAGVMLRWRARRGYFDCTIDLAIRDAAHATERLVLLARTCLHLPTQDMWQAWQPVEYVDLSMTVEQLLIRLRATQDALLNQPIGPRFEGLGKELQSPLQDVWRRGKDIFPFMQWTAGPADLGSEVELRAYDLEGPPPGASPIDPLDYVHVGYPLPSELPGLGIDDWSVMVFVGADQSLRWTCYCKADEDNEEQAASADEALDGFMVRFVVEFQRLCENDVRVRVALAARDAMQSPEIRRVSALLERKCGISEADLFDALGNALFMGAFVQGDRYEWQRFFDSAFSYATGLGEVASLAVAMADLTSRSVQQVLEATGR